MEIDVYFLFLTVILILIVPVKWLIAALLAATVHECFHLVAIFLQGGKILGIRIGAGGTVIYTDLQDYKSELYAALAGPIGSFLLVGLYAVVPRVALCAFVQGCFNLIPVFPLDGGRILHSVCGIWFPKYANRVTDTLAYIVKFLLCLVCFIYGCFYCSSFALWLCIFLAVGIFLRKRPCKPR